MPDTPTPLPIVVGGTIAIDNVKTPDDEATGLLGGSASYAALAASYFTNPVHLVGIVGADFPPEHLAMLEAHGIKLDGVERSAGESFAWTGEYHQNMNERTTHAVALNVLENWQPKLPPAAAAAPIVVLANMSPDNQLQMLAQCTAPGRLVIADTMDLWIDIARPRLMEVMKELDLFVLNDSEARELTATSNLLEAGETLLSKGPRHVIIKLGEHGAMLFSAGDEGTSPAIFRVPAFPLRSVADPTGAGDSFLGALAGHLAAHFRISASQPFSVSPATAALRAAVAGGTIAASFTCEAFSTRRLEKLPHGDFQARLEAFRQMTQW